MATVRIAIEGCRMHGAYRVMSADGDDSVSVELGHQGGVHVIADHECRWRSAFVPFECTCSVVGVKVYEAMHTLLPEQIGFG